MTESDVDPAFEDLLLYLKRTRGFDFTEYKRASLMRRVLRRMQAVAIEDFEAYQDYLEVRPAEFEYLFNTILVNFTGFFRDRRCWAYLEEEVIPELLATLPEHGGLRIWSAGCASGEEPYTLAMLLAEAMGIDACRRRVKIFATDVDEVALTQARRASYAAAVVEDVPEALRSRYFDQVGDRYILRDDLRRLLVFGRHDLMRDAPISRLDLLVCRNALIYFNRSAQRRIIANFHFALKETGFLFLGRAEMLLARDDLFEPVSMTQRVFRKAGVLHPQEQLMLLSRADERQAARDPDALTRLRQAAYDAAPVGLLVLDRDQRLSLVNARARAEFGLRRYDRGRPFRDLRVSYQPVELRSVVERAAAEERAIRLEGIARTLDRGDQILDIEVAPLRDLGGAAVGTQIAFIDVSQRHELCVKLDEAMQQVEAAPGELPVANEALETFNEKLLSTVEELRATNEEMETMNEEVRSANAELRMMNQELHERTRELDRANGFLSSILSSVDVGIVVIDRDFQILLWNDRAEDLWGLATEEVEGHSLLDLHIGLPVEQLRAPVAAFLQGDGGPVHEVTLGARNRRGQAIRVAITETLRLNPEGEPVGVVLLMDETAREEEQV